MFKSERSNLLLITLVAILFISLKIYNDSDKFNPQLIQSGNTMDYKKLFEKYPKAMNAFCNFKFGGDTDKCFGKSDRERENFWGILSLINDRELYDFLDQNKVRCFVLDGSSSEDTYTWQVLIHAAIYNPPEEDTYYIRTEAEEPMFLKGIEMLEKLL